MSRKPLKSLHDSKNLIAQKLNLFRRMSSSALTESLRPGLPGALKARPDGTVLDGHHRLAVLREREVDVDALPREIVRKTQLDGSEQS